MYQKWYSSIRMSYLARVMDVTQVSFVWNLPTNTDRILKGDTEYTGFKEAGIIALVHSFGKELRIKILWLLKSVKKSDWILSAAKMCNHLNHLYLDIKKIQLIYNPFYMLQDLENGSYSELYLYLSRNSTFSRSLISN